MKTCIKLTISAASEAIGLHVPYDLVAKELKHLAVSKMTCALYPKVYIQQQ
jgi:hypothetical protein